MKKVDLYGWFPTTNEETLAMLIKKHNIKTVIEIGCFLGKSTSFFCSMGCKVIAIDTFEGAEDINKSSEVQKRLPNLKEQFLYNMKALGYQDQVQVLPMTSFKASTVYQGEADLIFIDGSHVYNDVVTDILTWGPRATKVLCGDDYTDVHPDVKKAVDEFVPNANKNQRCWYLEKI